MALSHYVTGMMYLLSSPGYGSVRGFYCAGSLAKSQSVNITTARIAGVRCVLGK